VAEAVHGSGFLPLGPGLGKLGLKGMTGVARVEPVLVWERLAGKRREPAIKE
jgi:hypothetical protein